MDRRFRSSLALKIVVPFAFLTLVMGAAGTMVATHEVAGRAGDAFDAQLIHDGFVAQSVLQTSDAERRSLLKFLSTSRLAAVWINREELQAVLERALAVHPNAIVETVDPAGREIIGVVGHGEAGDTVSQNQDLSAWPGLQRMFNSGSDHVDLVVSTPQAMVFTGQPVRDGAGALLGALLVGDRLADLATRVKVVTHQDLTFFDLQGQVLTSTLGIPPAHWSTLALDPTTRAHITPSSVVQVSRDAPGPVRQLLVPWVTRSTSLGYVGVAASSAGLLANANRLRWTMAGLFLMGIVLTLLAGVALARRITRPVQTLVAATRLVSAGDLNHQAPVTTRDEIGELTASFNQMTQSLREKSTSLKETLSQLQDTYLMTIEALAAAVEARDPYTHGHTQRVRDYAVEIARTMGVEEPGIGALRRAAVLHDIGKIGIEDHILRKQTRLDPEEEIRMQRHTTIGVDMLKGIDFLEPVLPIIGHHHERYDGNGYPDQLRGDEIPLGARILAVADALDAMTSDRPYRQARTFEYAKSEILKGSGTHFDPEAVTAFIKSQRAIEELMDHTEESEEHSHPAPGELGRWRLHVLGH